MTADHSEEGGAAVTSTAEPRYGYDARYAATAVYATMFWHYLERKDGNAWLALCGERRRGWKPVVAFADPDAFEACAVCVAEKAARHEQRLCGDD